MRFATSRLVFLPVTLSGLTLSYISVLCFVRITILVAPLSLLSGTSTSCHCRCLFICSNCFNRWGEVVRNWPPGRRRSDSPISLTGMLSMTSKYSMPLVWPRFVATDCYPWNSCCLSTDRDVFMGPCTETAIIARLPCYSQMYMALSTYVLDFVRYVYISPFFWLVNSTSLLSLWSWRNGS